MPPTLTPLPRPRGAPDYYRQSARRRTPRPAPALPLTPDQRADLVRARSRRPR